MKIEDGKVVAIEYTVKDKLVDIVVDSNVGMQPLSFIVGAGQVIPGLENELKKYENGSAFTATVAPADAYGEYNEEMTETYPIEQFAGIELTEGMQLFGQSEDGQTVRVIVKSFDNESVVVDYNHVLAGKTLVFDIVVLDVRDATAEEIATGVVGGMGGCCGSHGGCCGGDEEEDDHECCGAHNHDDEEGCCGGDKSKHNNGSQCCGGAGH